MKNNTRLISAVLAAVLCGASLAACANNPTPPVTDVSDITTDIPATETPTTVAPVTVATTEVLATTDTPTTVEPITTVTTDAPATDAPATDAPATEVTTDSPATTEEPVVTTAAPVTTEMPATTEAPITTEPPVTTDIPETTAPETEEVIDTYGKPLSEVLYVNEDGKVKLKGTDTYTLARQGSYEAESRFVYNISPKMSDGGLEIRKKEREYPQKLPAIFIDNAGNPVMEKYYPVYTVGGLVACCVNTENAGYILTVLPDGTYNVYTAPARTITVNYCNDKIGLAAIASESNANVCDLYCTYDGGKTFTYHSAIKKTDYKSGGVGIEASSYGYFFVKINYEYNYASSARSVGLRLKVENGILSEPSVVEEIKVGGMSSQNSLLHIEDNLGVWSVIQSRYDGTAIYDGEHCVAYFITTDGGATWQRYDPAVITEENGGTVATKPTFDDSPEGQHGKKVMELLYRGEDGLVHIKGSDSLLLPAFGAYRYKTGEFLADLNAQTASNLKLKEIYRQNQKIKDYSGPRPESFVDGEGRTVALKYADSFSARGGVTVHSANNEETGKEYIVTVLSDGSNNISEIPAKLCIAEYYNESVGVIICDKHGDDARYGIYCTYDGGKTFSLLDGFSEEFSSLRGISVSDDGTFYVFCNKSASNEWAKRPTSVAFVYALKEGVLTPQTKVPCVEEEFEGNVNNDNVLFDGDVGVWVKTLTYTVRFSAARYETYYYYYFYITADGGKTWTIYDPAMVGILITNVAWV